VYQIGREQLLIFATTLVAVLATDLLIGIAIGIAVKMVIHVMNGVPLRSLFKAYLDVEPQGDDACLVRAHESAVFSNWISFRRQIEDLGLVQRQNVTLDVSETKLIDHTVMDRLNQLQSEFEQEGLTLEIVGLDVHVPLSSYGTAARKQGLVKVRRIVLVADEELEEQLSRDFVRLGATGFTTIPCRGAGRRQLREDRVDVQPQVRIEVIVPIDVARSLIQYVRQEVMPRHRVTASVETVEAVRPDQFFSDVPSESLSESLSS
jgi:MFS superfamily sulfate permease-like transporter